MDQYDAPTIDTNLDSPEGRYTKTDKGEVNQQSLIHIPKNSDRGQCKGNS